MTQQISLQDTVDSNAVDPYVGYLYALQHTPVYTLGSSLAGGVLPLRPNRVSTDLQFDVHHSDRAGEATFHGPGQIVFYPILDLNYFNKDINWYLRSLEQVIIDSCATHGIATNRIQGLTGVWAGDAKIAAMGIKLRRWTTLHGFSVNVCSDMRYFDQIVACGILDKRVGSLHELNRHVTIENMTETLLRNFAETFDVHFENIAV